MVISIKQGKLTVVQTGTVLISNNESTTITIDNNYNIVIVYKDDPIENKQNISATPNNMGVTIELKNFNNPLGTSTTSPIPIATQGKNTIYIAMSVFAIGVSKVLVYGLYTSEEGNDSNGK